MHVAIVEDDEKYAEKLKGFLERYAGEHDCAFNISKYPSGDAFLFDGKKSFDIVFMDIDMPGTNGMDTAAKLRKYDENVCLIFVTNLTRFALKGYEVSAKYYIVKPLEYFDFAFKLDKAVKDCEKRDMKVLVGGSGRSKVYKAYDVYYVESMGHKLVYHTRTGDDEVWNVSLKDIEKELSGKNFLRCGESYLVNLNHVRAINGNDVIVGETTLPISRSRKKQFAEGCKRFFSSGSAN